MAKKKTGIVDIPCTSCNGTIKDVQMIEDSELKCPHCGFVYILNKKTTQELFQEFARRSYENFQARQKT